MTHISSKYHILEIGSLIIINCIFGLSFIELYFVALNITFGGGVADATSYR